MPVGDCIRTPILTYQSECLIRSKESWLSMQYEVQEWTSIAKEYATLIMRSRMSYCWFNSRALIVPTSSTASGITFVAPSPAELRCIATLTADPSGRQGMPLFCRSANNLAAEPQNAVHSVNANIVLAALQISSGHAKVGQGSTIRKYHWDLFSPTLIAKQAKKATN